MLVDFHYICTKFIVVARSFIVPFSAKENEKKGIAHENIANMCRIWNL